MAARGGLPPRRGGRKGPALAPWWAPTSNTVSSDFSMLVVEPGSRGISTQSGAHSLVSFTDYCHPMETSRPMAKAGPTVRNLKLGISRADERRGHVALPSRGKSERNRPWRRREPWQMSKGSRVGSTT
jgi:hypothetical protein